MRVLVWRCNTCASEISIVLDGEAPRDAVEKEGKRAAADHARQTSHTVGGPTEEEDTTPPPPFPWLTKVARA